MNDEVLIENVKKYPALYDSSHTKYTDACHKNELWTRIGFEMKCDGQQCKVRWSNIRDTFRKSLMKNETRRAMNMKIIKYKYFDHLKFLFANFDFALQPTYKPPETARHDEKSIEDSNSTPSSIIPIKTIKREEYSTAEDSMEEMPETSADWKWDQQSHGSASTEQHPVDAFLAGIAPSLKSLSPLLFHQAKSDIFNAVQKYEFIMLTNQK